MAYTTIKKPSDYFNTVLITGDANDPRAVTGYGFAPDCIWVKMRSNSADTGAFDKVRGATKFLYINKTDAEGTTANTPTSFDSDGFTIGDNNSNFYYNGETFAYWGWRADGTSGSSNTDGSITSTVSANTTSGFSIVSYTGTGSNATVGHGLGVAPQVVIVKERSGADGWHVGHASLGFTKNLYLNLTNATNTETAIFNDTAPTSSVFSLGNNTGINESGSTYITYCFAEKKGFSKFGSYTGNGNADGTFVYTGFKPAWVMSKRTDATDGWRIRDAKRDIDNPAQHRLLADSSAIEVVASSQDTDFLSNGFKLRNTDGGYNGSGATYIYMAFAEEPLVGDNPCTAR